MSFSLIWQLGTDIDGKVQPRHMLPEWADQNHKRRRAWLKGMLDAAVEVGARDVWLAAPNGTHGLVALESEQTIGLDAYRREDIAWACAECHALKGGPSIGVMDGFGWLDRKRMWFIDPGGKPDGRGWRFPQFTVSAERRRVERGWLDMAGLGLRSLIVDHAAGAHNLLGEFHRWAGFGRALTNMEIVAEGHAPELGCSRVMWGWQIDKTAATPLFWDNALRSLAVMSGHTEISKTPAGMGPRCITPADMLRAAERFRDGGWHMVYACETASKIREIGAGER